MSSPADLTVDGAAAWLRLVAGLALYLLPGLAAADRLLGGTPLRLVWAPLFSFTLLALVAILLDFAVGLPLSPDATAVSAAVLALAIGRPRWQSWLAAGMARLRTRSRRTSA